MSEPLTREEYLVTLNLFARSTQEERDHGPLRAALIAHVDALREQLATVTQELEHEQTEILVCTECGRVGKHGWIGIIHESTPNSAEEYDTKCPECGSMSLDEDARSVVYELDTCKAQLATTTAHLEAQRAATYQAVAREHEAKRALAQACQIIRDGYGVVPITPADVAWATEALAKAHP